MSTRDHTTRRDAFRPNRLPPSARHGRPRAIPEDFVEIVADHRAVGRTDDDIALSFGVTVCALHKRFNRAGGFYVGRDGVVGLGIPPGRRWRDVEDAVNDAAPITRDELRGYGNHRRAS